MSKIKILSPVLKRLPPGNLVLFWPKMRFGQAKKSAVIRFKSQGIRTLMGVELEFIPYRQTNSMVYQINYIYYIKCAYITEPDRLNFFSKYFSGKPYWKQTRNHRGLELDDTETANFIFWTESRWLVGRYPRHDSKFLRTLRWP